VQELVCCGNNFIQYSMHYCTLGQCKDLRIWSGLEDVGAATMAHAREFRIVTELQNPAVTCFLSSKLN